MIEMKSAKELQCKIIHFLNLKVTAFDFFKNLIFFSIVLYGYEIFNFNLSIDEELHALIDSSATEWLAQGRWGMALLNLIFPYTVLPTLSLIIGLTGISIAIVILTKTIYGDIKVHNIIPAVVALSCPSLIFILSFNTIAYGIGIGFILATTGCYILMHGRKYNAITASLCFSFALSIYQSFILMICSVMLFIIIDSYITKGTSVLPKLKNLLFSFILSFISYYLIQKMLLSLTGTEAKYLSNFINLKQLLDSFPIVIKTTVKEILLLFSGRSDIYINDNRSLLLVNILSVIFILKKLWSKAKSGHFLLLLGLIIASIAAPFAFHLINAGAMPTRSLVSLPFSLLLLLLLGFKYSNIHLKVVLTILSALTIFQFSATTLRWQNAATIALEADKMLASQILQRINNLSPAINKNVKYFEVIGYHEWPISHILLKKDTIGASFFEWDAGNTGRILSFLRIFGEDRFSSAKNESRYHIALSSDNKPSWPENGSIWIEGDTLVLKFSDYSYPQKKSICSYSKNTLPTCGENP